MSFDFGPMQNLSNVQASHKSTPGGGGNTGYFKRGKGQKEEENFYFNEDSKEDSFEIKYSDSSKTYCAFFNKNESHSSINS